MKEENYKEYKDFNIKCIKTMLENLSDVDLSTLKVEELVTMEHIIYYNVYLYLEKKGKIEPIDWKEL